MPPQPLIVILLLLYFLLLAAALMVWSLLTMLRRERTIRKTRAATPSPRPANDEPRGVRVTREQPPSDETGDPFEHFIRAKNDELEF